jgi:hypothetical protein
MNGLLNGMELHRSFATETIAHGGLTAPTEDEQMLRGENPGCTVPDRLRWTSDFLDLASKAISIIACVQGLDYPSDLHRSAQQDLRAWARYLEDHPSIAADFDAATVVNGLSAR